MTHPYVSSWRERLLHEWKRADLRDWLEAPPPVPHIPKSDIELAAKEAAARLIQTTARGRALREQSK